MKINASGTTEEERFDSALRRLLLVSHEELQRRMKAEARAKEKNGKRKIRRKKTT